MTTIHIQDLAIDHRLDRDAMSDIAGSGLFGRAVGYIKRKVKRKVSQYRQIYRAIRSIPGALYRSPRLIYRSAGSWF